MAVSPVLVMLPISLVTHALRQLVEGRPWVAVSGDLLGLAAWAAAMLVAASCAFRWDDR